MIRRSWISALGRGVVWGTIAGFLLGTLHGILDLVGQRPGTGLDIDTPLAGTAEGFTSGMIAGLVWAAIFAPRPGAHLEKNDPLSLTDAGWHELLTKHGSFAEPARRWFTQSGGLLKKNASFWPLALRDEAGERSV